MASRSSERLTKYRMNYYIDGVRVVAAIEYELWDKIGVRARNLLRSHRQAKEPWLYTTDGAFNK